MKNILPDRDPTLSPHTNILGVGVSALNMNLAVNTIQGWIQRGEQRYVCVANVHTVTESQVDARLRRINNQAGMVTPDGMPLVWVSRLLGQKQVRRVYGPDLLIAACERSLSAGWRHYFYGGGHGVAETLVDRLCQRFPGLRIAGLESPPFKDLTRAEDDAAVDRINRSGADIVWVGLGAPKQEYWMAAHVGKVMAPVMVGVGAAFDFHAGVKKQAPHWMQRSGLEWLYRLASEPKRLWKRYLLYNPYFIFLVALQMAGIKKYRLD